MWATFCHVNRHVTAQEDRGKPQLEEQQDHLLIMYLEAHTEEQDTLARKDLAARIKQEVFRQYEDVSVTQTVDKTGNLKRSHRRVEKETTKTGFGTRLKKGERTLLDAQRARCPWWDRLDAMWGDKPCREASPANETETEEGLEGLQTQPTQTQIMSGDSLDGLAALVQEEEPLAAESDDEDTVLEVAAGEADRVTNTQPEPVIVDDEERAEERAEELNTPARRQPSPAREDGSTARKRRCGPGEKPTELEDIIAVLDRRTDANRDIAFEAANIHATSQEKVADESTRRLEAMLDVMRRSLESNSDIMRRIIERLG
ncbi:hypothetical protein KEM55_007604 [Ascosphaera atra]|nr:hypothetical protein KEM55_007604 [Ascosphaera atra]